MDIVEELESHAQSTAKVSKWLATGKMARNEAAGDVGATYAFALPEQTVEGRAAAEIKRLRAVLDATHKLVTEGALIGFIPTEGTWAERLYANQGQIHDALNKK
jgi:hypothetical protein